MLLQQILHCNVTGGGNTYGSVVHQVRGAPRNGRKHRYYLQVPRFTTGQREYAIDAENVTAGDLKD